MHVPSCDNSVFSALLHGTYPLQLLFRMLMVRDILCCLLNSSNIAGRSRDVNKACAFSARLAASAIDNSAAGENKPSCLGLEGMEILLLWRVLIATSSCCGMGPWSGSASQQNVKGWSCVCLRVWTAPWMRAPPLHYRSGCRTANPALLMIIRTDST